MISFTQLLLLLFVLFLLFGDLRSLLRKLFLFFFNFKSLLKKKISNKSEDETK